MRVLTIKIRKGKNKHANVEIFRKEKGKNIKLERFVIAEGEVYQATSISMQLGNTESL